MARYAIGDLQGCWHSFNDLLTRLSFDPQRDQLFLAGDLINRGLGSLEVLRFCQQNRVHAVLGNHDLYLLCCLFGQAEPKAKDTIHAILDAPDRAALTDYLLELPLVLQSDGLVMSHAGFWPGWDRETLVGRADATRRRWQKDPEAFFSQLFGNTPNHPERAQSATDLDRFTVNACTRMRMLQPDLSLNLTFKGAPKDQSELAPWYDFATWLDNTADQAVFGHWAALGSGHLRPNLAALDGGCVWGQRLSALNIDTGQLTHQPTNTKDLRA